MKHFTKQLLYILFFIIIFMIAMASKPMERSDKYNKYMCAMNDTKADCVTPLSEQERLK